MTKEEGVNRQAPNLPLEQRSNPSQSSYSSILRKEKPYQELRVPWLVPKTRAEDVGALFPPGAEGFDPRVGSAHEAMGKLDALLQVVPCRALCCADAPQQQPKGRQTQPGGLHETGTEDGLRIREGTTFSHLATLRWLKNF